MLWGRRGWGNRTLYGQLLETIPSRSDQHYSPVRITVAPISSVNSKSHIAVTDQITPYRLNIDGQSVVLVDTVGFDDTWRSDTEILREIASWLAETYMESVKLAGVIYMHDITHPRFTGSAMRNLVMFKRLVGDNALSKVILVASKWNSIALDQAERRLEELTHNRSMWGFMIERGSSVERFSGTPNNARSILKSILDKKHKTILNIQEELVDQRLNLSETEAGKVLAEELNKIRLQHEREMEELRREMREAMQAKDNELYDTISQEQSRVQGRLRYDEAQITELNSQRNEIEEIRRTHVEELRRLEDTFSDRLQFLEAQNMPPPPAYAEVQDNNNEHTNSEATIGRSSYIWALLKLFWEFGQKLLRPRLQAGYRRLEWRCVRNKSLIIYIYTY